MPRLAAESANGAMADCGPFDLGCSLPALDASGHRHCVAPVCIRLGYAVAASERFKIGQIPISPRVLTKVGHAVQVEPVAEFELKGIRSPSAAHNVLGELRGIN